jgi:copper transport protein
MWSSAERRVAPATRRGAALLGGALLVLALSAQPAAAHAVLVRSDPASGTTLSAAPRAVHLRFSEDIAPRFGSARLVDRDGKPVEGTRVSTHRGDPRLLTMHLPALPAGAYGVLWRVLAEDDGHTTSGVVVFSVGEGAGAPAIAAGAGDAAVRPADVVRRWIGVWLLAGLVGALAVAGFVLGAPARRDGTQAPSQAGPAGLAAAGIHGLTRVGLRPSPSPTGQAASGAALAEAIRSARRRLLAFAAACAVLGAVVHVADVAVEVARQAPLAAEGSRPPVAEFLTATRWGHLWLWREAALVVLAVLALGLRAAIGRPRRRLAPALAAVAAVLVLAVVSVEAIGSHAAALDQARGAAVMADAIHILTACLWLGALPALVLMLWPRGGQGAGTGALLRAGRGRLTGLAAGSVLLLVATGLYSAGREVETADRLLTTPYGRTLLVKGALLLVVGGIGLANAARLHGHAPGWLGSVGRRLAATRPSLRLVLVEAGAGALLLVAVGVLLETAPARGPARPAVPAAPELAVARSGLAADLVVTVSVTPNRPGTNAFTVLVASSRRPPPAPVDRVALALGRGGDASAVALQQVTPGRWFGTGRLGKAGQLRLVATVHRAGTRLAVPLAWEVDPPATAQPVLSPPGRRLAPYVNALALALLAGTLAFAAGRLRRTRRRTAAAVHPTQPAERVLEGMR